MRAIVATPPRRSALLLTIFLALFVCILGFAGAKMSLAQGQTKEQQPKEQQPKEPELSPTLTASCDIDPTNPSQRVISWSGRGWIPGEEVAYMEAIGIDDMGDVLDPGTGTIVGADGSFAGSSVYRGRADEVYVFAETVRIYQETEPVKCPVIKPPDRETTTPPEGTTTSGGGGGGSGGSSSSGGAIATAGSVFSGLFAGQLPDTGGGWAILLIAGAILIALGWLLVRLARRFAAAR